MYFLVGFQTAFDGVLPWGCIFYERFEHRGMLCWRCCSAKVQPVMHLEGRPQSQNTFTGSAYISCEVVVGFGFSIVKALQTTGHAMQFVESLTPAPTPTMAPSILRLLMRGRWLSLNSRSHSGSVSLLLLIARQRCSTLLKDIRSRSPRGSHPYTDEW